MWSVIKGVLGFVSEPIVQYQKNRAAKAQAKHERQIKVINGEQTWEEKQAEASMDSWKDEYLLVMISVPFILVFGTALHSDAALARVLKAVDALNKLPPEYWYLLGVVFSASFAQKGIPKVVAKIKGFKIGDKETLK